MYLYDITNDINMVGRHGSKHGTPEERFWPKVNKIEGGCWEWTAALKDFGHGQFYLSPGKLVSAHRFSFELVNGPTPTGLFVCHKCDNPKCVNPGHLFLGSPQDNMVDKTLKGRHHCEKQTHCKHGHELTPENLVVRESALSITRYRCKTCQKAQIAKREAKRIAAKTGRNI